MPLRQPIMISDLDGLKQILRRNRDGKTLIVFEVLRRHVETRETEWLLSCLTYLASENETMRMVANAVHITFSGYDDDPREVHQTPEIVAYMQSIHKDWKFWPHFVALTSSTVVLATIVSGTQVPCERPGSVTLLPDPDTFMRVLHESIEATAELHHVSGFSQRESDAIITNYLNSIPGA